MLWSSSTFPSTFPQIFFSISSALAVLATEIVVLVIVVVIVKVLVVAVEVAVVVLALACKYCLFGQLLISLIISWKLQINIVSHSWFTTFWQPIYTQRVLISFNTPLNIPCKTHLWCPSYFGKVKVKHACPFSITYTICQQWANCLTYSPCPEALRGEVLTSPNAQLLYLSTMLKWIDVSKLCLDIGFGKWWAWMERVSFSRITLTLKKGPYNLQFKIKWDPSEFNKTTPSTKTLYAPRHNLKPSPWGFGGYVNFASIATCSLDYFEQFSFSDNFNQMRFVVK